MPVILSLSVSICFYRMFRGPQILTCPIRPLLLLRDSHLAAFSEHTGAGWQGASATKERRYEGIHGSKEGTSLSTETGSSSTQLPFIGTDCDNRQLREASIQSLLSKAILSSHHRHPPQVSAFAKARHASDSWKCTAVEDLGQNLKAVSTYKDCLINTPCLQSRRSPWDIRQPSLSSTYKTQCNLQRHLNHRRHIVRSFSLSTHQPWILNHSDSTPHPSSIYSVQARAVHQAAPLVAETWRDCLSLGNENRCREKLGPNLKLYEAEKGGKGSSQSQGKNPAKWAAVLVSLCSVEGEPAFLFTLRSSTLKGRHKGDVR